MKKTSAIAALVVALGLSQAQAQAPEPLVSVKILSPEIALKAAQAALQACRGDSYQVAVAVVDRSGLQQVLLRDRFAGPHTPDTAYRKAWTAASFRTSSGELGQLAETGEAWALRNVTNALPLGGGVLIRAGDGSLVGAIGVSGAPSGGADEICANAGIAAIEADIAF